MNRTKLLKALKAHGFTGKTLDEALLYMKENNVTIKPKGADAALDEAAIKKAWDATVALVIEDDEPAAEVDADTKAADLAAKADADERLRQKRALDNAANRGVIPGAGTMSKSREYARKNYERRIKSGEKTVFSAPELAEGFTAACRVLYAQETGKSYAYEGEDRQILVEHGILTKTTTTLVNTNAGYLVNPLFSNEVLYNTEPFGIAVQIANVQNCSVTDDWSIKRKTGIMSMSHVGEGNTISTGNATYDRVHLIPKTAGVLNDITQQMLDDSAVNVADEWAKSVKEARDVRIDADYILGDGSATYGGHVGLANGLVSGAYVQGTGATWASLVRADISKLVGLVQNVNLARCGYLCSRQFYATVMQPFQTSLGGVTLNEGVTGGGAKPVQGVPGTPMAYFNGWPVWESQTMPTATAASSKCLYFGDFVGGSMVGLSKDLQIDISKEFGFDKYKTYMRAVTRFAINICGDGRASTYGNIVSLATTA